MKHQPVRQGQTTTLGPTCPMMLSWVFFELEASPVEGHSVQRKDKKIVTKREGHFIVQIRIFYFCTYPGKNVIKHDVSGKKGMLLPSANAILGRLKLIWFIFR